MSSQGLLFDFDTLVVDGRRLTFNALKSTLHANRMELTEVTFARYFTGKSLRRGLDLFVRSRDKGGLDDALLVAAREARATAFAASDVAIRKDVVSMLKAVQGKGIAVGGLTSLKPETLNAIMQRAGLADVGIVLYEVGGEDARSCSSEHWLQLARKRNVKPRAVLVICTSAPACRAALAAKMNCMALPDAFTSHQDFSGADGVLSAPDTRAVEEFFSVRR